MSVLLWLKALPWIVTVRESAYDYPIIETLHGIGMGLLVGALTIINLRLLGLLKRMPIGALAKLPLLIWTGFAINACTGIVMFMTDGPRLVTNWIFLTKLSLIAVGVAVAIALQRNFSRYEALSVATGTVPLPARYLSCVCLLVWYGAIVAGRVTAFLGDQ